MENMRQICSLFTSKECRKIETQTKKAVKNGIHTTSDGDFPELRSGPRLTQAVYLYFWGSVWLVSLV